MLLSNLDLLATASGGVARLRELILTLAVQGKLVPQDAADEPASVLLAKIRAEKERLIEEGEIKRGKPLGGISEEEKPFGLPVGWQWTRWADIAMKIGDIDHKMPSETKEGVPYVSPRDFYGANEIDFDGAKKISYSDYVALASKIRPELGDLIYPRYGTIGIVRQVTEEREFLASYSCAVIKVLRGYVDPDYQYLFSVSLCAKVQAVSATNKTTQPNVGLKSIQEYLFPLPPLTEQFRIVARVEELMQLCDALVAKGRLEAAQHARLVSTLLATLTDSPNPEALAENWQRVSTHFDLLLDRPEAVDALEQTLLQLAVRGLLVPQDPKDEPASALLQRIRAEKDRLIAEGKIKPDKPLAAIAAEEKPFALPVGWEWARVGSVGTTQTGGTPASSNPEYFDGNFPFIGPGQISPRGEILPAEKFISERGCLESSIAQPLDILMVCIGGSIGKCAPASFPAAFNQQINAIHPLFVNSEYAFTAMTSSDFVASVISAATGSATPIISKGKWDLLLLPIPPLPEQSRIVARVASLRRVCAGLRQRLAARQATQAQLAHALIQKAA